MEELARQVRRAQWLLGAQRFAGTVGWCCAASLFGAVALIIIDKLWPIGVQSWMLAAAALGLGVAAAAFLAVVGAPGRIDAAIEIDRRFKLKERVSSALAMDDRERETAAGKALLGDAIQRIGRIDVREHFKVSPGWQIVLPLLPAVLAVLAVLFIPGKAAAVADPAETVQKHVKKSSASLRKKLLEKRDQARQQGLREAQDLFRQLGLASEELTADPQPDRKKALVKLNDLARQIEQRRQGLGGAESIQKQFQQLKNVSPGPADKLLDEISRGNFQKAIEQLQELKEDLAKGTLSDKQRQDLARQLEQMQKKLQALADAHRQAVKDLEDRVDHARQEGRRDDAEKLQEQLNKLRQQLPQMNRLEDLASKLGQCSRCLQEGQLRDAQDLFGDLEADLNELSSQLEELEMLDEALDQLAQCREEMNQMDCPFCGGAGCEACNGGIGLGAGQGAGPRPEEQTDVTFRDTKTPQNVGPGAATVVGEAAGPNVKGAVGQEIKDQYQAARLEAADPLTGQQMPRKHRQHATEYFNRFREGK